MVITSTMNVLMDIQPPTLSSLTVNGRLQLYGAIDITLITREAQSHFDEA